MKKILFAAAAMASATLSTTPVFAEDEPSGPIEVTGSAAIVTDYRFRGVSQTNKEMAFQAGVTVSHESGLYAGQDGVILSLAESDGMTAGGLAQKLGVKAPTMTRTIGRMEAQGFLERKPDAEDARLTKVYLTELGRGSVQGIEMAASACDRLATQAFSEKEIRNLVRLLKAIDGNLQAEALHIEEPDED